MISDTHDLKGGTFKHRSLIYIKIVCLFLKIIDFNRLSLEIICILLSIQKEQLMKYGTFDRDIEEYKREILRGKPFLNSISEDRSGLKYFKSFREYLYDPFETSDLRGVLNEINSQCVNISFKGYECGQCPNCLAKKASEWTDRILDEVSLPGVGVVAFTLTYTDRMLYDKMQVFYDEEKEEFYEIESDDYVTEVVYDEERGEFVENRYYTVSTRDQQLFKKRFARNFGTLLKQFEYIRFRKEISGRLRFFIKGEYGTKHHRPHYHGFVSCQMPDIPVNALNWFLTKTLLKSWNNALLLEISNEKGMEVSKHDYPDLSHPFNDYPIEEVKKDGKWLKGLDAKHPFVAVWSNLSDISNRKKCASYCAKYVSKYTASMHPQVRQGARERCWVSTRFGYRHYEQQLVEIRDKVITECNNYLREFQHDVKRFDEYNFYNLVNTLDNDCRTKKAQDLLYRCSMLLNVYTSTGNIRFVPSYLRRQIFGGYYVYPKYTDDNLKEENKKNRITMKYWKSYDESQPDCVKQTNQMYHDCFSHLMGFLRDVRNQEVYNKYFHDGKDYREVCKRDSLEMTSLLLQHSTNLHTNLKNASNRHYGVIQSRNYE